MATENTNSFVDMKNPRDRRANGRCGSSIEWHRALIVLLPGMVSEAISAGRTSLPIDVSPFTDCLSNDVGYIGRLRVFLFQSASASHAIAPWLKQLIMAFNSLGFSGVFVGDRAGSIHLHVIWPPPKSIEH